MSFLGEEYEPKILEYDKVKRRYFSNQIKEVKNVSGRNHEVYRNWQINQPLMKNTVRWVNELSDEEKIICEQRLHYYLTRFGYFNG